MAARSRRKRHAPKPEIPTALRRSRSRLGWIVGSAIAGILALAWWVLFPLHSNPTSRAPSRSVADQVVPDQAETYARYAGSNTCRECHQEAWDEWAASNHGMAERKLDEALDRPAFDPPKTFRHGTQQTEARIRNGRYELVTLGYGTNVAPYEVVRVIGHNPLRQFLIPRPGGRFQVSEAAWDPITNEWFNVYGQEDRRPGEWGHWTGRGMCWNAMCAACHNTRLRKNYDEATDTYHTAMVEPTVSCEACHGPMKNHVVWQRRYRNSGRPWPPPQGSDPTLSTLSTNQVFHLCGSCHARRGDVTGDFHPGADFFDHYSLTIVDETDTFYPDGQIRDEDYEFAPFLGSRMHFRGVVCMDCHTPHRAKPALQGNDLCLRCHNGSREDSPLIDPATHTFHAQYESGHDCRDCHMPQTPYMQRHWRHDHGFTIPDPRLTKEWGIPNACNRCHRDQSVDWAIEWTTRWYGEKMDQPKRLHDRNRTRWLARARQGDPAARQPLLEMLDTEPIPYWRAAILLLLRQWTDDPQVRRATARYLADLDPLVREKAVHALGPLVEDPRLEVADQLRPLLEDPVRAVRVAAAWALRAHIDPASRAGRELLHMLDFNADQPLGQLQKAVWALAHDQPEEAWRRLRQAVAWDPNSAPLRHELAIVCSLTGRTRDAVDHLEAACRLEPEVAEYAYKLGLAWNELDNLRQAIQALQRAVKLDPRHARAWYNLGLARNAQGDVPGALDALLRAESADPNDPRIPYARATILAQQGRFGEARQAAARALEIRPDFSEARQLLQQLP